MSDGPLVSLSIAGLHASALEGAWSRGVRSAIGWVAGLGFRAVQLDAAAPEIRARHLDRSGRRDLAAAIRRADLGFTGLDLWIPAEHFEEGAHADRAHAALLGAVDLAADLRGLVPAADAAAAVVSVTLPAEYGGADEVRARADGRGVLVEDFGSLGRALFERAAEEAGGGKNSGAAGEKRGGMVSGVIRPGVDTGRAILRGDPPGKTFAKFSDSLATLRANDADDTGRREMGRGTLGVETLIALHATLTPGVPIVTDVRGLDQPERAAGAALDRLGGGFGLN